MAMEPNGWVIVAGAGGALGRRLVEHYAETNCPMLALDENTDATPRVANVKVIALDLSSAEAVEAALDNIPRTAPIRLLVNAVGLIWNEPAIAMKGGRMVAHAPDSFAKVINSNLTAAFVIATRVAARMARKGGGAIVNFSSISAAGVAGQVAYSAAKAGVTGMTRAMAAELGPLSVRVNAIAPGFIDVRSTHASLSEAKLAEYVGRTPVGRLGAIEDVVHAVDFLATNPFANGVVLDVDGGLRL